MDSGIPQATLRLLSDRGFEKRKAGAHEVETLCRRLRETGNKEAVRRMVATLAEEFALSIQPNQRKGGLIGLASCAIGLGPQTVEYLPMIVGPVLRNFNDAEPRVRYYACESLFNITKICRGAILAFFGDIFVGVCKLVADVDGDVKNGAALYDRLLKEVVMEGENLDVRRFIPLLRAHMGVMNPYVRQLLVGWITALDSVPGVDMLDYVPDLLEGLFDMLSDGNREIRQQAYGALSDIMDQMLKVPRAEVASRIRFAPMVATLIAQTARERDKFNRVTAVEWLVQFMILGGPQLAGVYAPLAAAVLRCLSDGEPEIAGEAAKANAELMMLVRSTVPASSLRPRAAALSEAGGSQGAAAPPPGGEGAAAAVPPKLGAAVPLPAALDTSAGGPASFDAAPLIATVTAEARNKDKATRAAALRWLTLLMSLAPVDVMADVDAVLDALLCNLSDTSDADTLKLDLEVLARLCCINISPAEPAGSVATPSSPNAGTSDSAGGGAAPGHSSPSAQGLGAPGQGGVVAPLRHRMLGELVRAFGADRSLLESKGAFILRRLCMLLDARLVYTSLARILAAEPNREFAALAVELLNLILLTAVETADLRESLRGCAAWDCPRPPAVNGAAALDATAAAGQLQPAAAFAADPVGPIPVFMLLYRTWVVNPVATFSLCLLAHSYELCARVIAAFAERTITVGVLMQCDKLVQLLESPIFVATRMHLTQPYRGDHSALMRSLYGLLMILPQGTAFATLRDRLASVAPLAAPTALAPTAAALAAHTQPGSPPSAAPPAGAAVSTDGLFDLFQTSQSSQWQAVTADVRARSILRRTAGKAHDAPLPNGASAVESLA